MKTAVSGERNATFGQMIQTLRRALDLTPTELAGQLGVSRQTMRNWEVGNRYPKAEHLKQFIELAVQRQVFSAGHEMEEIHALWKEAHQKVLLDEEWLHEMLAQTSRQPARIVPFPGVEVSADEPASPAGGPRVDWGDALVIPSFYGRDGGLVHLDRAGALSGSQCAGDGWHWEISSGDQDDVAYCRAVRGGDLPLAA